MSLSCLCVVTPENSNFPNFNWINLKLSLGVDFRALISKFIYMGSRHIDKSVFDFPYALFSPDYIILFENLGAGR